MSFLGSSKFKLCLLYGIYIIPAVFGRQREDYASVDKTAIIIALYNMSIGAYSFIDILRNSQKKELVTKMIKQTGLWLFLLFSVWCMISSFWSSIPLLTLYRSLEAISCGLFLLNLIIDLYISYGNEGMIRQVALFGFVLSLLTIGRFYFIEKDDVWKAISRAQFLSTSFVLLAFQSKVNLRIKAVYAFMALLSRSVTGYVSVALGVALGMLSRSWFSKMFLVVMVFFATVILSYYSWESILNDTIFHYKEDGIHNGKIGAKASSGRTYLWENAIYTVKHSDSEFIGFGFVAGETGFAHELIGNLVIGFHNGFVSAYFGTGLIGLVLMSMFLLKTFWLPLKRNFPKKFKSLCITLIPVILCHTFANPGIGFRVGGTWIPCMILVMIIGVLCVTDGNDMCIENE